MASSLTPLPVSDDEPESTVVEEFEDFIKVRLQVPARPLSIQISHLSNIPVIYLGCTHPAWNIPNTPRMVARTSQAGRLPQPHTNGYDDIYNPANVCRSRAGIFWRETYHRA